MAAVGTGLAIALLQVIKGVIVFPTKRRVANNFDLRFTADNLHTAALTQNGQVVVTGDCFAGIEDGTVWSYVLAVASGSQHVVAVLSGGRVLSAGDNSRGQCDVEQWRDMVEVAAGTTHTLGLRTDGIVLATGNDDDGQCSVTAWNRATGR